MTAGTTELTIVTALLRSDAQVQETARSVVPQLQDGAEWLIKNSDATPSAALQALVDSHPRIRLVAQPDSGLYNGLNQALAAAAGTYVQVLGAGDLLREGALSQMLGALRENARRFGMDSVYFPVYHRTLQRVLTPDPAQIGHAMSCPHPGAVLKTAHCLALGGFNEEYRIAADYDLIARYLLRWTGVMVGEFPVVDFAGGGMSETRGYECMLETELVKVRLFGKRPY